MSIGNHRRTARAARPTTSGAEVGIRLVSSGAASLVVTKVGGSLLRHEEDLLRAASAIVQRSREGDSLMVVVSAFKGVTDQLEQAALYALDPHQRKVRPAEILSRLRQRHEGVALKIGGARLLAEILPVVDEIESLVIAIRDSGLLRDETYARLLSAGERLSAPLLAAAIRQSGAKATSLDAEAAGLRAHGELRDGQCDVAASRPGLRRIAPRLRTEIQVLTGFYGINTNDQVVLFGRGGSDDTACAVAAGLDAPRLEFWKDVPGCMSADPREVHNAHVVAEVSFDEIATLGAYGSRIIHHGSLVPLKNRSTEVVVRALDASLREVGTRLLDRRRPQSAGIVALAAQRGSTRFRLHCPSEEKELAGSILGSIDDTKIEIKEWGMAPGVIDFTACSSRSEDLLRTLRPVINGHPVERHSSPSRVGMVGEGIHQDPDTRFRALEFLAGSEIRGQLDSRTADSDGLSCIVHQDDLGRALGGLHEHFFPARAEGRRLLLIDAPS